MYLILLNPVTLFYQINSKLRTLIIHLYTLFICAKVCSNRDIYLHFITVFEKESKPPVRRSPLAYKEEKMKKKFECLYLTNDQYEFNQIFCASLHFWWTAIIQKWYVGHRAMHAQKCHFLSSCPNTHSVACWFSWPHDTLPCVLIP